MEKVKIRFIDQYNKIVNAYMQNKLNPSICEACFVGNLLNNNGKWGFGRLVTNGSTTDPLITNIDKTIALACLMQEASGFYTMAEIAKIEQVFLGTLSETGKYNIDLSDHKSPRYEERLFKAMEVTLEHLKALHIAKGEIIEDNPIFSKRELVEA